MERIEDFVRAIDRACDFRGRPRSRLQIIGSAALRSIAGRGSPLAGKHRLHLDVVNLALLSSGSGSRSTS